MCGQRLEKVALGIAFSRATNGPPLVTHVCGVALRAAAERAEGSPRDPTDRALAERFLESGDEAAFRTLYRAHTPYLLRFALRLSGGRREEAEEAVQETWLRAAKSLSGFRWGSSLRTWLSGITVNCCHEQRRRAARDERPDPRPSTQIPASVAMDLETAVLGLPDGLREVLVLHVIEGYTHEEIGTRLGIAPGTSRSRLFDARLALKTRFGVFDEGVRP